MDGGGPYASSAAEASATPTGTRLPHLSGLGAELRQVIAAHALRSCEHVVEIGGAGLPITNYLTRVPRSVTVIDPKIAPYESDTLDGTPCRVRHVAAKLQQVELDPAPGRIGLVLLGLSLKPFGSTPALPDSLLDLTGRAEVLVIDHAVALDRALGQIGPLMATRRSPPVIDIELVIKEATLATTPFGRRRLLVFAD